MATYKALLTVFSPDRVGLISEVTGLLFDHGVNIGDTSFSILGKGGGFNSIVEIPQDLSEQDLINALKSLASLIDADIDLKRFSLPDQEAPPKSVTHQIWFEGSDQPGLLARISEVFTDFGGNIISLKSEQRHNQDERLYITQIDANIPPERASNCLATLANTAAGLGQKISAQQL